jgi:enoyl-CoA hydratase/carnithine racemase
VADVAVSRGADRVAVLALDRPRVLNALDTATRLAVAEALEACARDPQVAAVVLTGRGDRAYCAGQDVNESAALGPGDGPGWMASWEAYFAALSSFPKPIVHAVNGVAAGGGLETALLGDVRVAVPSARFLMAEIDIGLPAIVGGALLLAHLGLSRTTEIVLSGRTLDADEARQVGLVHEIVPPDRLLARARARAAELAAKPPVALSLDLRWFRARLAARLREASRAAVAYQSEAIATGEPQRAMARFLERRRTGITTPVASGPAQHGEDLMSRFIRVEQDGDLAIVTLNRPEVMNAWHAPMRAEIVAAMERLNADPSVRAIILTGAGDRAFSAGQDLNETKAFDAEGGVAWVGEWRRLYGAIRALDKPLVAALNGVAAGSAFQVALLADVRIGHPDVRMGQPEINSGIASTLGPWLMQEMLGLSRAVELTLTGRMMDAAECHQIGLVHRVVPKAEVMAAARETARALAAKPPIAMRLDKRRFREVTEAAFNDALEAGIPIQRESYGSGEPQRCMAQFLAEKAKRKRT